jgi:predicted metal-dependent peptidase
LEQTLEILKENGDFLKNSRVRILQCDDGIRDDIIVSENSNIDEIFREFNLKGGGNTDFRPVFSYVNELINSGTISEVDGLVYFTDGKGIYPKAVPQYKTAFVFLEGYEGDKEFKVPSWCYREVIYKSSLERYER